MLRQTLRRFATTVKPPQFTTSKSLYELRLYTVLPRNMVGYFTVELGGLNQVCHLWKYGSLFERAEVRTKLSHNKDWMNNYLTPMLQLIHKQENCLLKATQPFSLPKEPSNWYVLSTNAKAFPISRDLKTKMVAEFNTLIGTGSFPRGSTVRLFCNPYIDDTLSQYPNEGELRLLIPTSFSPVLQ